MAGVSLRLGAWGLVTGVAMVKGGMPLPLALLMGWQRLLLGHVSGDLTCALFMKRFAAPRGPEVGFPCSRPSC